MKLALAMLASAVTFSSPTLGADPKLINDTITLTVGYGPGGSSDRTARIVGNALAQELGVPVLIENRPGAGGRLAAQQFTRTEGHENALLLGNPAIMSVAPVVYEDVGYDPKTDFQPVGLVASYTFALAVPGDSELENLSDLQEALSTSDDDLMMIGVPATGSLPHFFGMMVAQAMGGKAEIVGYKGSAPLQTEITGGHIPYAIDGFDSLSPLHAGGQIRILATSGTERETDTPDVPTFKESGFDIEGIGWNGFWAHASMPQEKVQYINDALVRAMHREEVQSALRAANMGVMIANVEQTQKILDDFDARWVPVVVESGFTR